MPRRSVYVAAAAFVAVGLVAFGPDDLALGAQHNRGADGKNGKPSPNTPGSAKGTSIGQQGKRGKQGQQGRNGTVGPVRNGRTVSMPDTSDIDVPDDATFPADALAALRQAQILARQAAAEARRSQP